MSIQHLLPDELSEKLKFINGIRNKAAHEVNFQLYNPDRYIQECSDAMAMLQALDFSSGGNAREQFAYNSGLKFDLQPDLLEFRHTIIPYLIDTSVTFDYLTGKVTGVQERNYTIRRKDTYIDKHEQKIWLQCADGLEKCVEPANSVLPIRKGQTVTILYGTRRNKRYSVAVYIQEMGEYYHQLGQWRSLLFWPVFSVSCSGLLVALLLVYLLRQYFFLLLIGIWIVRHIFFKKFEAHIVRIFQFEQQTNFTNEEYPDPQTHPSRGDDLRIDLTLELREAALGTEKEIAIPHLEQCQSCQDDYQTNSAVSCSACNGATRIQQTKKLMITIPAGVDNGTRLRISREGDAGVRGGEPGDLYVYLTVQ